MYAETELMFPSFFNFAQEVQQFDELWGAQKTNSSLELPCSLIQTTTVSNYSLGGAGDLFNAPEPVITEEPMMGMDPMISMISCGKDGVSPQSLYVSEIESSIQNGQLLSDVFYECKKDILAKDMTETPFSEMTSINIPDVKTDENGQMQFSNCSFQKSVSSSCLSSMDFVHEAPPRLNFLDFPAMDFGVGIRRAFSEGDMKTIGNGNISFVQSPLELPKIKSSYTSEDRNEKLSRYRNKKSKRNFGRKIKYACRKALADGQPRIRGRFAKPEEVETLKKQ